jgi:zinc/manganese transport system substrate-binding protein
MIKIVFTFLAVFFLTVEISAKTKIVVTYPYIADLVNRIGLEEVTVTALAAGSWDPHQLVAKPSYIAKLRQADILIINGAQLEIGWLPPVVNQANNPAIQPNQKGFLDLSTVIRLIDKPFSVSRGQGDVHPDGNPHFILDPHNVPPLIEAIAAKLAEIDRPHADGFRQNSQQLLARFTDKLRGWDAKLAPLAGTPIVEYHRLFDYFIARYKLTLVATIEPLPGIPPSAKHINEVIDTIKGEKVKWILQDVYHPADAARLISEKTGGVRVIVLPHDVDAVKEATDIIAFYDEIVRRITQ